MKDHSDDAAEKFVSVAGERIPVDEANFDINGRKWILGEDIKQDPQTFAYNKPTQFIWEDMPDISRRKELDYFLQMMPISAIVETVRETNERIKEADGSNLSFPEYLRYIGIQLAHVYDRKRGSLHSSFFSDKEIEGTIDLPADYANRFGMSMRRFKQISRYLQLCSKPDRPVSNSHYNYIKYCQLIINFCRKCFGN
jgi:hypothetical protein